MSKSKILPAALILIGGIGPALAAEHPSLGRPTVLKHKTTHEEIAKRQKPKRIEGKERKVQREDVLKTAHRNERSKKGLLSRSAIISSSYDWSMVPKGAVLHVPKIYSRRVNGARNGKLIGWQAFYGKNRNWIRAVPVTVEQASGKNPLTKEFLDSLNSSGQVLVAVCRGGPISVKLPPEKEDSEDPAAAPALAEGNAEKTEQNAKAVENLKNRLLRGQR